MKSSQEVLNGKYFLGVVTSPIRIGKKEHNSAGTMSVINLAGTVEADHQYSLVTLTSLSTFMREWVAVQSIKSAALMPLAPYLLKAAPVISVVNMRYDCLLNFWSNHG